MRVQLSGFKELEEELAKVSKAVGRNALRRAGMKAMQPMANAAAGMAPVESGALRDSITVGTKVDNPVGRSEFAAVMRSGGTQAEAVAALRGARRAAAGDAPFVELYMGPAKAETKDEAIKAVAQEFGTSRHGPQPYMRPAFDAEAMPTLDRLKDELWTEVTKAVARAERRAARAAARGT
jgi:HK97 gp10 family phage protein